MCLEHFLRMTLETFTFFPSKTIILWRFLPFEGAMWETLKLCEDMREREGAELCLHVWH